MEAAPVVRGVDGPTFINLGQIRSKFRTTFLSQTEEKKKDHHNSAYVYAIIQVVHMLLRRIRGT